MRSVRRTGWPAAACLVVGVIGVPVLAGAQEPVQAFDQLQTRLRPGNTVAVTDTQGREIRGKLGELTATSLTILGASPETVRMDAVRQVVKHTPKPIVKGTLWGLAAGAALSFTWLVIGSGDPCDDCTGVAVAIGLGMPALSAGLGAAIGAALPAKSEVVYRVPGGRSAARVSLAPMLTPRRQGVAVAVVF